MWYCQCGWHGEKVKSKLDHLPTGDEAHAIVCPSCGGEDLLNTDCFQLVFPGLWTSKINGCPHLWQGICTLRWEICTYVLVPIQACETFREMVHQWSTGVDRSPLKEEAKG